MATSKPPPDASSGSDQGTAGQGTATGTGTGTATAGSGSSLNAQALAALAVKTLVAGTRFVLVPLAQLYARPPVGEETVDAKVSPDALTPFEKASLSRAAQKLVIEAGGLLTANFRPVPEGTTYQQPTPDQNGSYGEPSLAAVVSAVTGVRALQASRQAKRDAQAQQDQVAPLRPVSMQTLRALRRG